MADPVLQIRGTGHPDPEIRGGCLKKKFFSPLLSFIFLFQISFNHYFNGFCFQRSLAISIILHAISYFQIVTSHYL